MKGSRFGIARLPFGFDEKDFLEFAIRKPATWTPDSSKKGGLFTSGLIYCNAPVLTLKDEGCVKMISAWHVSDQKECLEHFRSSFLRHADSLSELDISRPEIVIHGRCFMPDPDDMTGRSLECYERSLAINSFVKEVIENSGLKTSVRNQDLSYSTLVIDSNGNLLPSGIVRRAIATLVNFGRSQNDNTPSK